ncbi:MAG: Adenylosuccinate lyase [Chlamydiae bacterium]|nr:Adenylosuccinate lyase [Chlamydiota bacterium]
MNSYVSPLSDRYASVEMRKIFSPHFKYSTWRKLWVALAEAEQELGLPITDEQIQQLCEQVDNIDFEAVEKYESELHHDVMAHIKAYGDLCPLAAPIIHLGSTSCYVTDNTDLIQIREAYRLIFPKLLNIIDQLAQFADRFAELPCLGFTHFQPAQLTTVGKRACMWLQDLVVDFHEMTHAASQLKFLGAKGATGTQASFYALFDNDVEKLDQLDHLIAKKMEFENLLTIAGQTYSRKQDILALSPLSSFASSVHKFATDIRLLSHLKEIQEGFGAKQVGSSAMPYKRNPMLSERLCALSRFIIASAENTYYTCATQWLERTLDDSANRRLVIPEIFLTTDALLNILQKVISSLTVNPEIIARRVKDELPFIATENIMMEAVKNGGNRQKMHERLRQHSIAVTNEGKQDELLQRLSEDPEFNLQDPEAYTDPSHYIGASSYQVKRFLKEEVDPILKTQSLTI